MDISRYFDNNNNSGKSYSHFKELESNLSPNDRIKLHEFFDDSYKSITLAKSCVGISAGLTAVYFSRRKRLISPTWALFAALSISTIVFQSMPSSIHSIRRNKILNDNDNDNDNKLLNIIDSIPNPGDGAYFWAKYFS